MKFASRVLILGVIVEEKRCVHRAIMYTAKLTLVRNVGVRNRYIRCKDREEEF